MKKMKKMLSLLTLLVLLAGITSHAAEAQDSGTVGSPILPNQWEPKAQDSSWMSQPTATPMPKLCDGLNTGSAASSGATPMSKNSPTSPTPESTPKPTPTVPPTPKPEAYESILDNPELILKPNEEIVGTVSKKYRLPRGTEVTPGTVLMRIYNSDMECVTSLVVPELPEEQAEFLEKLGLKACLTIDEHDTYISYHLKFYRENENLILQVYQSENMSLVLVDTPYLYYASCIRSDDGDYDKDSASVGLLSGTWELFWSQNYWREEHNLETGNGEYSYVVAELAEFSETTAALSEQEFADMKIAIGGSILAEFRKYVEYLPESYSEDYLELIGFTEMTLQP